MSTELADPVTDPGHDSYRREAERLLLQLAQIRRIQAMAPDKTPDGLSDAALARHLMWDMVATLTRGEVVLADNCDIIVRFIEELQLQNQLRVRELGLQERAEARQVDRESRRFSLFSDGIRNGLDTFRRLMLDPKVIGVFVVAMTNVITAIMTHYAGK